VWVPEPLGFDELGREILSFIPGDVPHEMPGWAWSDVVLSDAARALRHWHDATVGFERAGAVWNLPARTPAEVICHNDFAPYNCVFRAGRFAGAIDFDVCSPGPRSWDIAYTAYRFVPLMPPRDADVAVDLGDCSPFARAEMLGRLDAFLATYATAGAPLLYERAAVLESTIERLHALATWTTNHVQATGAIALERHPTMYRAHARWLSSLLRGR
jgi:Ser/Thr protein kinase RdoA (MazF antagonist)